MEHLLAAQRLAVWRVAKSATGLSRPDVLDWVAVARAEAARFRPHLVVVLVGSNDGQDLALVKPPRRGHRRRIRRIHWRTASWSRAYRRRLEAFLAALSSGARAGEGSTTANASPGVTAGAPLVLWLGLPPVRSRRLERKLSTIRALQRAAVGRLGARSQYAGLRSFLRILRDRAPRDRRGRIRRGWLRKRDGVHFSFRGAHLMALAIAPLMAPWVARAMVLAAMEAAGAAPPSLPQAHEEKKPGPAIRSRSEASRGRTAARRSGGGRP